MPMYRHLQMLEKMKKIEEILLENRFMISQRRPANLNYTPPDLPAGSGSLKDATFDTSADVCLFRKCRKKIP